MASTAGRVSLPSINEMFPGEWRACAALQGLRLMRGGLQSI